MSLELMWWTANANGEVGLDEEAEGFRNLRNTLIHSNLRSIVFALKIRRVDKRRSGNKETIRVHP